MAGYWDIPAPQDWGLGWHCNEGIEIGYVSAGRLPFEVDSKSLSVGPGTLTITRPWQRHRVGDPHLPPSHYSWIILDVGVRRPNQDWRWPHGLLLPKSVLTRLTWMLRQNEDPVWHADRRIGSCFARIDETVALGASETQMVRLKIAINELLILLAECLEARKPQLDASLPGSERTVRLFLENLSSRTDEPWTLDSMAEACGLGRTRFSALCQQIANLTPVGYLARLRLEQAAALLQNSPEMSITEIAFRSGFESSQYFARVFRAAYRCTPSEHRQRRLRL